MYTIGKRERTTFLDERGMAVDGYRIWFRMEDGTVDYVEIEKVNFNPSVVHEAIEQTIAEHGSLAGF
jgi:hypothetical protein